MFTINHLLYGNSVPPNTLPVETKGRSEALPSSTDTQESAVPTKVVEGMYVRMYSQTFLEST